MDKERALKVLTDVHAKNSGDIPFRLIQEAYEAESEYLFEDDSKPMSILKQIAEDHVDETASGVQK